MTSKIRDHTEELGQSLRATMDRLSLRVFYWLRMEGEARTLSANLGQRITECLDALLQSLTAHDFVPIARFLSQEKSRGANLEPRDCVLQTIALLDACERSIEETLETDFQDGDRPLQALTRLRSLVHQSRRYWLQSCIEHLPSAGEKSATDLLASIGRALDTASDLDELVQNLFAGLHKLIPHEDGQLLLWGPRQEQPLVHCTNNRLLVGHGGAIDRYSNWVAFQRNPLLVANLETGPEPANAPAYRTYIGVPILQADHLVGTLALVSTQPNVFDQNDLDTLVALAPALGAAIQRVAPEVGPLQDLHRRLEEQNIILTFGREMTATLEENRIYSLLLFKALELTDSDAGAVLTVDPEQQEYTIQALAGYAADLTAEDTMMAMNAISWNVGVVGWVARTGKPALIANVQDVEDYLAVRPETRSQLSVPIKWREQILGVLNLENASMNAYTDEHLQTAETLADHAAVAIGTTRLYNEVLERREWLAGLVANLPEGIVVTDDDLGVILSNPASAHFFHLEQQLANGVNLKEYLLSRLRPFLRDPQALINFLERTRTLDQGQTEAWIEFKEAGGRLWLVGTPLWGEGSRLSGRVILIRDARQDEDSEREKLGFVSVVSHELRSPLTSILGYSELLLSRDFPRDRQQQFLEIVFSQAEHLSNLVDDLLSLSRLSRGRMRMNWSMATFHQIVSNLATQLDAQMSDRHTLLMEVAEDLPPFYLDRDKVRVVLNNLINNAVKYSPQGGEIVLHAELITDLDRAESLPKWTPPPFLLVGVQDHGIGIDRENLPHIFDRFYRVDNTNTRQIGGSGLGLAVTKALVEIHGGTVWVSSQIKKGSTFSFTLPVREQPPMEDDEDPDALSTDL